MTRHNNIMKKGQYGPVPGSQTVPRAEATALIKFFTHIDNMATPVSGLSFDVYTDAKIINDGFHKYSNVEEHQGTLGN